MSPWRKVWQVWKRFGRFTGDLLARVVLTIFYFTILLPFGLAVRLFSDPLKLRRDGIRPAWLTRETGDQTIEQVRRQF
jgi:hypothetical protein